MQPLLERWTFRGHAGTSLIAESRAAEV